MSVIKQYDSYLDNNGPAAIVLKQALMSVEGTDGVIFPATYASGDGFSGGYNIDYDANGRSVALIDSVGSQANRIEPIFGAPEYSSLVPQITVRAGEKEVSILEAGHRAGDAIVRCSSLHSDLRTAFNYFLSGDATTLAKIAPTSLVFGVWDSRDTQAKIPRVIASTIRAYDVRVLKRSAQYNPAIDYVNSELLEEPSDKASKDAYSERGFIHVPATGSHGGVIADGGILRTTTLGLAALRLLHAGNDQERTLTLRRYILGLSLISLTHNPSGYLRQGCILVLDPESEVEYVEVYPNGERKHCRITHEDALEYANAVANEFVVGESKLVPFDKEKAKQDVAGDGKKKGKTSKKNTSTKA